MWQTIGWAHHRERILRNLYPRVVCFPLCMPQKLWRFVEWQDFLEQLPRQHKLIGDFCSIANTELFIHCFAHAVKWVPYSVQELAYIFDNFFRSKRRVMLWADTHSSQSQNMYWHFGSRNHLLCNTSLCIGKDFTTVWLLFTRP